MKMEWLNLFVLSLILSFYSFSGMECARILCASHQYASHLLMTHSVVEGLLSRGHEVYTIYSDQMKVPRGLVEKGFKVLKYHTPPTSKILSNPAHEASTLNAIFSGTSLDKSEISLTCYRECADIDNDKNLEKELDDLKFDIIVLDAFPPSNCLMFLALKLKLPFILVSPSVNIEFTRNPVLPSFFPLGYLLYSDEMSFIQRVINTMATGMFTIPALSPFPANWELFEKYNEDESVTTWNSLARKAELHFVSRAGIIEYPIPTTPNLIIVECLSCKPGKSLPKDIQDIADQSEGIIVVSFGSMITHFPDHTAEKFLSAFAKRKELIFWRYTEELPGTVPPNVKIMKWLPQNDLLAHPKTKLFITHGGNNGQYESVYHGVPMLAFPLFAEQPHNAHRITVHGYGLECNIVTFTSEELSQKMATIIDEPSFREKTQHAGKILKKMPMDAQDTATYWIEHVLEFGSDHLRSHALDMPWYSFYMFDIILFFEVIFVLLISSIVYIIYFVLGKINAYKSKEKKKKN